MRAWSIGRFLVQLPESSQLTEQTQQLDGIKLTIEPATGLSLTSQLAKRAEELTKDQRSPLIAKYEWTGDTGAVLHVMDISDPTYYEIEARRLLPNRTLVATTDGDKSKVDVMQTIIREILQNYVPSGVEPANLDGFGLVDGSLRQRFRNTEEMHAEFTLPGTGTRLEFNSKVIARPAPMDLVEREGGPSPRPKRGEA